MKKVVTVLLAFVLIFTNTTAVMAESVDTSAQVTDESSQETTPTITYVVVNSPNATSGEEQTIIVGVDDESKDFTEYRLNVKEQNTGETYELSSTQEANGIVFRNVFPDGKYTITNLIYMDEEQQNAIDLQEIGIDCNFGVGEAADTNPDAVVVDDEESQEVGYSTVTFDDNGSVISENNIADTIRNAEGEESKLSSMFSLARSTNKVVVLDPGHDSTHKGTSGGGLGEDQLTWKIAQYCKAELETYSGITVYMTRDGEGCPHPGTTSQEDNVKRVEYAKSVGANVYVSIHLNAGSPSAVGAEVYYPNANYQPSYSTEGKKISEDILAQLEKLGLANRGAKVRDADDGSTYADGTTTDWYGVIRNSKLNGFPGIIIEHAFMSSDSDFSNFLNSETKLHNLGIADATGIAQYFGLDKDPVYSSSDATISGSLNENSTKYSVGVTGIPKAYGVRFAVWNANNSNGMKWYSATEDETGKWNVEVPMNDFKLDGAYNVHCYVDRSGGSSYFIGATNFELSGPTADKPIVNNINKSTGTFDVTISNIVAAAGVKSVAVPVWTDGNNQDDIYWYTATKQNNGSYVAHVSIANHKYRNGNYIARVYVTDGNEICKFTGGVTTKIEQSGVNVSITPNTTETVYTAQISGVPYGNSVKAINVASWSETGGQDDLVWYSATKQADGSWKADIKIANHKTAGKYIVHVYASINDGTNRCLYAKEAFEVQKTTASSPTITNVNEVAGTFDVSISGVKSAAGISKMQVPVWGDDGNIVWYNAEQQKDGSYMAHIDIANHSYKYGTYNIHVYATDYNGIFNYVTGKQENLVKPIVSTSETPNTSESVYSIKSTNVPYGSGVKALNYAVWSEAGGQDDLVWYQGAKQRDGSWAASIPILKHKTAGKYFVHTYASLKNGENICIAANGTFTVAGPTAAKPVILNENASAGTFDVSVPSVTSKSGIKDVKVPVWISDNQIVWYQASKQSDGSYLAHVNIANHSLKYGKYNVQVYATDGNNIFKYLSGTMEELKLPAAQTTATSNSTHTTYSLTCTNVPYGSGVKAVNFAVWSEAGGQDDLIWYPATKQSDGSWTANATVNKHKTEGKYAIHTYAALSTGENKCVNASGKFTVKGPSADVLSVNSTNSIDGTFTVTIPNATSESGLQAIDVGVWCVDNQSDMVWYRPTRIADGTYEVYVDIKNHKGDLGNYKIHVYASDNNGIRKCIGATNCLVSNSSNAYYNIVGSTATSVTQLESYYNSRTTYPSYYANSDAPTLHDFCQIYMDECNAEGIKVEVAFCQAMKETGFLRFPGDVKVDQYNFAGIGATGGGEPGNSFSSVREGVRAQVQHLKAYATTAPLNNTCVDPRYQWVTKGCAPYVEWLGKKENPSEKGWATDKGYGISIKGDYISKLLTK